MAKHKNYKRVQIKHIQVRGISRAGFGICEQTNNKTVWRDCGPRRVYKQIGEKYPFGYIKWVY